MVQCSRHVIPPAITANLTNQPAHDLGVGLNAQRQRVLTDQRLGTILLTHRKPNDRDPLAAVLCAYQGRPFMSMGPAGQARGTASNTIGVSGEVWVLPSA